MIRDRKGLTVLLVVHGLSAEEAADLTELINHECPWFGEAEEVSEEIGVDMLADVLPPKVASLVGASRLIAWHNKKARGQDESHVGTANAAYASLVQTIGQFGVEGGLGSGDFWVMEDSFSGPHAIVMVFKPLPLPEGLQRAVIDWLNRQDAMKKITLVNREGDGLFEGIRK